MSQNKLPDFFSDDRITSPFFRNFQREMTEFLDRFRDHPSGSISELMSGASAMPALDIAETEDSLEITAEIPGVKEEDLDVSITEDVLILKGEKSIDREETKKDYRLVERRYGSFRRRIPLGFVPEPGAVEAEFDDGVLKLKIAKPKATKASVQKIKIGK